MQLDNRDIWITGGQITKVQLYSLNVRQCSNFKYKYKLRILLSSDKNFTHNVQMAVTQIKGNIKGSSIGSPILRKCSKFSM